MSGVLIQKRSLNRWANDRIQPGNVGSVGDVLGQVRVKQSSPDMAFAWDTTFSNLNEVMRGSNVQDGNTGSFTSNGMGSRTIESSWERGGDFKTQIGWRHQDISAPDKLVTPVDQAQPSYSWKNRQAQVFKSRVSGQNFLPLPGGFQPEAGSTPRGGQVPRITDVAVPETISLEGREGGSFLDAPPTNESFFRGTNDPPVNNAALTRSRAADQRRGLGL